jgi:hypothetical protein
MALIPAKDYYGKDESITSVGRTVRSPPARAKPFTDTMDEDEKADEGGATSC